MSHVLLVKYKWDMGNTHNTIVDQTTGEKPPKRRLIACPPVWVNAIRTTCSYPARTSISCACSVRHKRGTFQPNRDKAERVQTLTWHLFATNPIPNGPSLKWSNQAELRQRAAWKKKRRKRHTICTLFETLPTKTCWPPIKACPRVLCGGRKCLSRANSLEIYPQKPFTRSPLLPAQPKASVF